MTDPIIDDDGNVALNIARAESVSVTQGAFTRARGALARIYLAHLVGPAPRTAAASLYVHDWGTLARLHARLGEFLAQRPANDDGGP